MNGIVSTSGFILTALYILFVFSLYIGLSGLRHGSNRKKHTVTVVTAARNEEQNIGNLLDALLKQDYPPELYTIIIVNDRSEDKTRSIVEEYQQRDSRISIIDVEKIPGGFSPKKYALTLGIQAADSEIICTTDADCIPPPAWISSMNSYFTDDVGLVAGFSPLFVKNGGTLFTQYLYIDSLSLAAVAAGGIGMGTGWTCAGRNLAYRRSVFDEVGGFEPVKMQVSGDDDLLMHLVQTQTQWKLGYAIVKESTVPSFVQPGLYGYIHQRTRHASKFRVYPLRVKAAAFMVFLFYAALGLFPVYMAAAREFLPVYGAMLTGKFGVELLTVAKGARVLEGKFELSAFFKAFFIHPFLIVLFSIRGFRGKFTWKDRDFNRDPLSSQ